LPGEIYCRRISEPGQQYALYHHHSHLGETKTFYIVTPGDYTETLVLNLPGGTYKADWVEPASGKVLNTVTFTHQGGNKTLTTSQHSVDVALRIKRR
jgi:hypothetical protein